MQWAVWMDSHAPFPVLKSLQPYHEAYVDEKKKAGKIVSGGTFVDLSGAMFVLNADTYVEAEKLAEEDPLVAQNACQYAIKPWTHQL